jgi:hypothetical protein
MICVEMQCVLLGSPGPTLLPELVTLPYHMISAGPGSEAKYL